MATLSNSVFMNLLLKTAETKKTGNSLSVEVLFLAMLDYIVNSDAMDMTEEQIKMKNCISGMCDPMKAERKLSKILKSRKETFMDSIMLQKLMNEAETMSKKLSRTEITADTVASCIIASPTHLISQLFQKNDVESASSASEPSAEEETAESLPDIPTEQMTEEQLEELRCQRLQKVASYVEKTKKITNFLLDRLCGQNNAISTFASGYFQSLMLDLTDRTRTTPRATFLFAGPPGVGKTFLAESAAEVLGLPYQRFDMSEYSDKEAALMFCGSDTVYKNSAEGHLTSFVKEHPRCVLLFDEIEKCHTTVIHIFLQMLDAGRVKDNFTKQEVSFKDTILIFTTNAGRQAYENSEQENFASMPRKVILNALEKDINPLTGIPFFPPAICSRFATGNVVMFNKMNVGSLTTIVKRELDRNSYEVADNLNITVQISDEISTALLFAEGKGCDARTVKARAQSFFNSELFELFRIVDSESVPHKIEDIKQIHFTLDFPTDETLHRVFAPEGKTNVLVFSSDKTLLNRAEDPCNCHFIYTDDLTVVEKQLVEQDIKFVLVDIECGTEENHHNYLSIKDVESLGKKLIKTMTEKYPSVPVYILQTKTHEYSPEERVSLLHQGVRDIVGPYELDKLREIAMAIHQEKEMLAMTSRNNVLTFETAQILTETEAGLEAEIKIINLDTKTAVEAEDGDSLVSSLSRPDVKFSDVIGADDVKEELRYFSDYLKNPRKYAMSGLRTPRGVLLYGPPGTGKTLLAKALAGESETTFISAQGNQFLQPLVGLGSETVHKLFRTARKYAPSVIFIDEIDAIGSERTGMNLHGGEDTLTALLAEMDGFSTDPSKPVFVLAATNYDVSEKSKKRLDPALSRRFDRQMYVDLPTREERRRYLQMKFDANAVFDVSDQDADNLAARSVGKSLADLESVLELSMRSAFRMGSRVVTGKLLDDALETYNSGEKKKWSDEIMLRTARHEAGHTLICCHAGEKPSSAAACASPASACTSCCGACSAG